MSPRRFLLISRIGPESLHPQWLAPAAERDFDLLLSAYSSDVTAPESQPGVFFEYRRGRKVAGYGEIIRDGRCTSFHATTIAS